MQLLQVLVEPGSVDLALGVLDEERGQHLLTENRRGLKRREDSALFQD